MHGAMAEICSSADAAAIVRLTILEIALASFMSSRSDPTEESRFVRGSAVWSETSAQSYRTILLQLQLCRLPNAVRLLNTREWGLEAVFDFPIPSFETKRSVLVKRLLDFQQAVLQVAARILHLGFVRARFCVAGLLADKRLVKGNPSVLPWCIA